MIIVNVLIDSSGWVEFFAKGKKAQKFLPFIEKASKNTHFTPTIVLYEVFKIIKRDLGDATATESIAYMIDSTQLVPLDERLALQAAELSLQTGLAMADAMIKVTAELHGAILVTGDKHFKGMEGVEFVK